MESSTAVVTAPDGKILVSGYMINGSSDIELAIARFDATGVLDPTFGTGGMTTAPVPGGSAYTDTMVRLPSGRIVVAGSLNLNTGLLAAYDDDGNLDAGFGTGGIVVTSEIVISAIAVAEDAIVAVGALGQAFGGGAVVARFGFDGTMEAATTFLPDGSSGRSDRDRPVGRTVIAGGTNECDDTFVARLLADGTFDPNFGTDGVAIIDVVPAASAACDDFASALALQPDGSILVASTGQVYDAPPSPLTLVDWYLSRLDSDGTLDLAFDNYDFDADGHVFLASAAPRAMALQADGKVVTVGRFDRPVFDFPYFYSDLSLAVTRNEAMPAPVCSAAPRNDCAAASPRASTLKLKSATSKRDPQLAWCFKKGSATAADFGNPTTGGSYALCLYDATNALVGMTQVEGGGICGGKPCWKAKGATGWQYANKRGTSYGVDKVKIKTGTGNAVLCVQGKHANLPVVPLPATLPLRAQFQTSAGSCFDATYGTATRNDTAHLSAKN